MVTLPLRVMKGSTRGGIRSFENIKITINCQLIEESQNDQYKNYSVFDDLQDGSKQKFVAFMVYDFAF